MRQASHSQRRTDDRQSCRRRGLEYRWRQLDSITRDPGREQDNEMGAPLRGITLIGTLKNPLPPFDTQFDLARGAIVLTDYGSKV
ncbi:hypothetical protein Y882_06425 [Dyella japonica DSM 16301]|uniref:Uncharacterized protein n=1 Tax=Dyella japonica DSM 16301 TaxID=1440762 RepID=A0A0G9HAL5_9GAMM|nr:hypothetical protein Y882_06425 [Dyella japonica DSM 16301]